MTMTRPAPPAEAPSAESSDRLARSVAVLGALAFLPFGIWAMLDPRSFFDQLAEFHPYNQHFIQDIGAFQIGLGAALLIAALWPRLDGLTLALLGGGAGAAAHALSHVVGRDLGVKPASDIGTFTFVAVVLLTVGVLRLRQTR
jgi:hypothetical protein